MFEWVTRKKFNYNNSSLPPTINNAFEIARKITNGTKHCIQAIETKTQRGFSSDFSDDFARPLIVVQDDGTDLSVDRLIREIIDYWRGEKTAGKF